MNLLEKLERMSPEQERQLMLIRDNLALDSFLEEHGIEMNQDERQTVMGFLSKGVVPLNDDAVEAAAGGKAVNYWDMAFKEGRTEPVQSMFFCMCGPNTAFAARKSVKGGGGGINIDYFNVKCYSCGKTQENISVYMGFF